MFDDPFEGGTCLEIVFTSASEQSPEKAQLFERLREAWEAARRKGWLSTDAPTLTSEDLGAILAWRSGACTDGIDIPALLRKMDDAHNPAKGVQRMRWRRRSMYREVRLRYRRKRVTSRGRPGWLSRFPLDETE
jgi:hypothetical protein